MPVPRAASYVGLKPASKNATRSARGASAKRDTRPELALRKALRGVGLRGYRVDVGALPGRPDVVFHASRVAIFCDGDFWHGRNLDARMARLKSGHNAQYWVQKICGNVARDRRQEAELVSAGWLVLRYWETHVKRDGDAIATEVHAAVSERTKLAGRVTS